MKNVNTELRKLAKFLQSRGYTAHANEVAAAAESFDGGRPIRKMATGSPGPTPRPKKKCSHFRRKAGGSVNHNSAERALVRKVQVLVDALNRSGRPDGCYGPTTKNKVIAYARTNGKDITGLENGDDITELHSRLTETATSRPAAATTGPALPDATTPTYSPDQMAQFLSGNLKNAQGKGIKELAGKGPYGPSAIKTILEGPQSAQYIAIVTKLMKDAGFEPASAGGAAGLPSETMSKEERNAAVLDQIAAVLDLLRKRPVRICVGPRGAANNPSIVVNRVERAAIVRSTTQEILAAFMGDAESPAAGINALARQIAGALTPSRFNAGGPIMVAEVYLGLLEVGGNTGRANGIRNRARRQGKSGEVLMACYGDGMFGSDNRAIQSVMSSGMEGRQGDPPEEAE